MAQEFKKELEDYISDWHWDNPSKQYAFEMGKFLFAFRNYLDDQKLSEKTKRNHKLNVGLIGMFEAGYGYNEEFDPEILEGEPDYVYEFERKVSNSKSAIQSYKSTWQKLDKYIKSGVFESYLEKVEERLKKETGD